MRRERLTSAERAALRTAEAVGYLVVSPRMSAEARGAWCDWCNVRGHPIVIIKRLPRGRADITFSAINCAGNLTAAQEEAIAAAFTAAGARRGLWPSEYSFGTVGWDAAEPLARALVRIVLGPSTREASP